MVEEADLTGSFEGRCPIGLFVSSDGRQGTTGKLVTAPKGAGQHSFSLAYSSLTPGSFQRVASHKT